MIDFTPSPNALSAGPAHLSLVRHRLRRRACSWRPGSSCARPSGAASTPTSSPNGIIVVAIAALIGGRAVPRHRPVVALQGRPAQDHPAALFGSRRVRRPITGIVALFLYTRWKKLEFWTWMDIAAPGVFVMQAVARWGNFFNQELYGPPTNLPWGIAIDCAHRVAEYACPPGHALAAKRSDTPGPALPADVPVRVALGARSVR